MKTTLDELQTFIAIVDLGSITAAAEELDQTPSGISRTLARLENKLDVTLLRRTTRKLDLTSEGERFLNSAREIIQSLEAAEEAVGSKNTPAGVLRVDSASPFILHSVVPYIPEFHQLYPNVQVELFSSERNIDLLENRIDVAIRLGNLADSSLHAVHLGQSKRRVLASPSYLKKHGTPKSVEDLQNHKLIGFTDPKELNQWPLKNSGSNRYLIKPDFAASSGETLLHLARQGLGLACLSDFMTGPDRESGALVPVLTGATSDQKEQIHAIYYKNAQLSLRADVFIKFLKAKLKNAL
ncbi:LysR family transcriptional regulator [Bdellovibrio sp. NC01]|uniref:LysR family transcriptional regulator n=1 Tax=Bdellovibrio sp. NC01 TaxID=2220073 RepID=UPI0011582151|nr:LysR family transcriptional regulator [Bdellovibrio sp. NC01]QDK37558.1 LysR family transcriptional regulator [Bdellovibrio sp. NC01]